MAASRHSRHCRKKGVFPAPGPDHDKTVLCQVLATPSINEEIELVSAVSGQVSSIEPPLLECQHFIHEEQEIDDIRWLFLVSISFLMPHIKINSRLNC